MVEIVEGLRRSDIMVVLLGCLCGLKDVEINFVRLGYVIV